MIHNSILHEFIVYVIESVLQNISAFQLPPLEDRLFSTGQCLSTQLICITSLYVLCHCFLAFGVCGMTNYDKKILHNWTSGSYTLVE
jgi:hypothetical protein